ncbi:MAG TPA: hypothetical protein DCM87_13985 [Planctomycetes bacterium]|nr:hypothetical protein [Planctomycetota bacterium]
MVRGAPAIVLCGVVLCACAAPVFAFGEYASRIVTPVEPFALAYVPSAQYLIVCQMSDGQAGRYRITAPGQTPQLEPMFTPVTAGDAVGIAWVEQQQTLYWLVETTTATGFAYNLLRTNLDGWSLTGSIALAAPADAVLGEMTYVPSHDAFWVADIANDRYLSFDRTTGARRSGEFYAPTRHRDARISYGLGIEYVPVGPGYFDLLVGTVTDQRAVRVIRVDLLGNEVGASYTLDFADQKTRPGWPAGLAYCRGLAGDFTVIADAQRRALLLFGTPAPEVFGLTAVTVAVQETEIGGGATAESIRGTFSWRNNGTYSSIVLEARDAASGDFATIATAQGGATTLAHELGREGRFQFRLTPVAATVRAPAALVDVRTAAGAILGITSLAGGVPAVQPFALALIDDGQTQTLLAANTMALSGTSVRRFRRTAAGALEPLASIAAPFAAGYVIVAMAWDSTRSELVWLGLSPARDFEAARTTPEGAVIAAGLPLIRNPFLQDQIGDMAYDARHDLFWVSAINRNAVCSFRRATDGASFVASSEALPLPSALPGEAGTWGLPCGLCVVPGAYAGMSILYAAMGQVPDNASFPQLGAGYVKRLVPLHVPQSGGPVVAGMPIDLEMATGSAGLRGMALSTRPALTAFFAAQDVAHLYEIRMHGEGPRFARGDTNSDGAINIADAPFLLAYLFSSGPAPACLDAADINDNGALNLSDAVALLRYVFGIPSQTPLAVPYYLCNTDPIADTLSCAVYAPCQ